MKRSFFLFGVIALATLVSCQREAEQASQNTPSPYYDPDDNTVRTEFVMNISTGTGKDTKTTAKYAQDGTAFLGMDAVHILSYQLPYATTDGHSYFYKPYYTNPTTGENKVVSSTRDFSLGMLFNPNTVTAGQASRSIELSLPLGTNAVVLYGKALKTESDDLQGASVANGDPTNLTSLTFSLKSRLSSTAAYDAGAFFFTRMLTYFVTAGLVNEGTFWNYDTPISTENHSYGFWWPTPTAAVLEELPESPVDGDKKTVGGLDYVYYAGELSWKQLGVMHRYEFDDDDPVVTKSDEVVTTANGTKFALSPLGEVLGDAYNKLTVIEVDATAGLHEIRAGSASALLRTMQDLYSIVERASEADPTSWEENAVQLLADLIKARMDKFFFVEEDGEIDFLKKTTKKESAIDVEKLLANLAKCTTDDDWENNFAGIMGVFDEAYFATTTSEGFPINVGLPHGSAAMVCDVKKGIKDVDTFAYTKDIPAYGMGDVTFPITNYRYPAELMYFGNSPLHVSNKEKKAKDYPSTITDWNEGDWDGWTLYTSVKSDTRSVAMVNNINYGTALLASTVKFGASTLKDNNHALHPTEADQTIPTTYTDANKGIFVTGIIVGGQADVMGFDFVRHPSNKDFSTVTVGEDGKFSGLEFTGNAFDKMIYDKVTTPYKVGAATEPIYTMVWDNYDHSKAANAQSDVYIGVELVNKTDMDIWGELNLIRKGGTFYLVGKMSLDDAIKALRAQTDHADDFKDLSRDHYCYPPYNPATGATINAPRVFMQDYKTTATLVLGADALKHAYVTVPDLRSSQVSLGLSIDMEWEPGLAFTVDLGK